MDVANKQKHVCMGVIYCCVLNLCTGCSMYALSINVQRADLLSFCIFCCWAYCGTSLWCCCVGNLFVSSVNDGAAAAGMPCVACPDKLKIMTWHGMAWRTFICMYCNDNGMSIMAKMASRMVIACLLRARACRLTRAYMGARGYMGVHDCFCCSWRWNRRPFAHEYGLCPRVACMRAWTYVHVGIDISMMLYKYMLRFWSSFHAGRCCWWWCWWWCWCWWRWYCWYWYLLQEVHHAQAEILAVSSVIYQRPAHYTHIRHVTTKQISNISHQCHGMASAGGGGGGGWPVVVGCCCCCSVE